MNFALDWKKTLDLFFLDTVQRRTVIAAQLLLLVLLAATLADLTWRVIPEGPEQPAAPPLPRSVTAAPGAADGRNWDIARWHLFGIKPAGVETASVDALPETNLNLVLRGVIATSRDGEGGGAIIGVPTGAEDFYRINARLPGGALLKEVHPDRVVLERGGRLETLRLPKEVLQGGSTQAGTLPDSREPALTLRQYRDMVITNPQQFTDLVKVTPRSEGGRFVGYEIQAGRDPALLDRMGLTPGDVVTSINGIALDSPAKALGIMRTLVGTEDVRIDIMRNGVPESLIVSVQE